MSEFRVQSAVTIRELSIIQRVHAQVSGWDFLVGARYPGPDNFRCDVRLLNKRKQCLYVEFNKGISYTSDKLECLSGVTRKDGLLRAHGREAMIVLGICEDMSNRSALGRRASRFYTPSVEHRLCVLPLGEDIIQAADRFSAWLQSGSKEYN